MTKKKEQGELLREEQEFLRKEQELLEKLEKLRQKGVKIAPVKEISDKWAKRKAKKRQEKALKLEHEKAKEEALKPYRLFFPDLFEDNGKGEPKEKNREKFEELLIKQDFNRALWKARNDVKEFREAAVRQGKRHLALPDDLKDKITLAFLAFNHDRYRDVLWSLVSECLKVQDREAKILASDVADRWLSEGKADFGWIMSMLAHPYPDEVNNDDVVKQFYVSRYGWGLLRKHAKRLAPLGCSVLRESFDYWASLPETWEKWNRLASKDGLPADMRVLYAMYAGNNP